MPAQRPKKKTINLVQWYKDGVSNEMFAGTVLLGAAAVAFLWANSPWFWIYEIFSGFKIGFETVGFNLPLRCWVQDGVLAIFFFVVGLELKNEFVKGGLSDPKRAAVPMIAAFLGLLGPIGVYLLIQVITGGHQWGGWVVPVATDIAFAVGLLGILGRGLPAGVRTFLLTLAVVDDLLGIVLIAVVLTETINFVALTVSFILIVMFAGVVNREITFWWLLVPIGVGAWGLMFLSGVHATVAGVLLGLSVPAVANRDGHVALTDQFLKFWSPISAGIVLPVFAFFAAGIDVGNAGGVGAAFKNSLFLGIMFGLPFGKFIGIFGGTALLIWLTPLALEKGLRISDLVGMSLLAGVGFTVSLLLASLSFPMGSVASAYARIAVIFGSFTSVVLATFVLRIQVRLRRKNGQNEPEKILFDR